MLWPLDRHRRIAVWVLLSPYITVLCTYVHLDGLVPARNENAPRPGCVHEGAAGFCCAASLTQSTQYGGHIALLCMQFDTVTGPFFIFGIQKWLNSPTGGSKRPMPHATRPPASRAEEAISDRQHLLAEINHRSPEEAKEGNCFNRCPKVHTSFMKEWTETNPRSYLYIHSRDLVSAPSRHLRSHKTAA